MPVSNVLRLDEYRDRREGRRRVTRALYGGDSGRGAVLPYLEAVADLTDSDRVALVWVDEFAPRTVHPWLVLDVLSDHPRRGFSVDRLHSAWEQGIPGTHESFDFVGGRASGLTIALGSDGARGWFLLMETAAGRPPLDAERRAGVMFLAGECSAVVLHRDLDAPGEAAGSFTGFRFLEDAEGHEGDATRGEVIRRRFAVGRLVEALIEEDLVLSPERAAEAAERVRLELGHTDAVTLDESEHLEAVVNAYERVRLDELVTAVLALGDAAERVHHLKGAAAAFEHAFTLSAAIGDVLSAVRAARSLGRSLRRQARWQDAEAWYARALDVAEAAGLGGLAARSMSGIGLVKRDVGNLPAARTRFDRALEIAEAADDREALASVHHDLMGLEQMAGDLAQAMRHGWRATNTYTTERGRTRCMASLGGVLLEAGALDEAEDAFAVVEQTSDEHYYLGYAADALAHIAALRGDGEEYDALTARADLYGWQEGAPYARAEILCFRGLSCASLGRVHEARAWLAQALECAAEHGVNRILFKAERALASLETGSHDPAGETAVSTRRDVADPELRDGLRSMRRELVGAGV